MKRQANAFWNQLRAQPAAIVAIAIMLAAALATVTHAYCMRKAVDKTVQEAFVAATVADPALAVVERKVKPYANAGITQFFCSGASSVVQAIIEQRIMFFQPTTADILCDFTVTSASCTPSIDLITCSETVMPFPANRKIANMAQLANTLLEPSSSTDCTVYVHDGIYKFSKVALWVPSTAWVQPGQPQEGPCYLVMPRNDVVTKLIMLLRPAFIRSNGSLLYKVAYNPDDDNRTDADWFSYTSWDEARPTATLRLIPVTDNLIDPPSNQRPMPDLIPPLRDSQRKLPATLDAVVPRSDLSTQPMILYFLKYNGPNQTGKGMPSGAASIYQTIDASFDAQARSSDGKTVLRVSRIAPSSDITLEIPSVSKKMSIPAIDNGVVVATRTGDAVMAAVFGPSRVAVRRWTVGNWLVYSSRDAGLPGTGASEGLQQKIGINSSTCIPCFADIALRTTGLLEFDVMTVDIENQLNTEFGNSMDGSVPLRPGKFLMSTNRRFVAKYQADCNLVVWDTTTNFPVWDSKTRMVGTDPGTLELKNNTGVLVMTTSSGATYWQSTTLSTSRRKDLGQYKLTLDDDGIMRIRSSYGNLVVWESNPGTYGTIYLSTCRDAAVSYHSQHSGEQSFRLASGSWDHYQRFGKTAGYLWPGPEGPC